jgi:hypothetical protein
MHRRLRWEENQQNYLKKIEIIIREKVSFFGNLVRDVARAAKERSDAGFELINRRSSLFRSLLLQYSATEKNRHIKGLDASDEKLIIKLELQ